MHLSALGEPKGKLVNKLSLSSIFKEEIVYKKSILSFVPDYFTVYIITHFKKFNFKM